MKYEQHREKLLALQAEMEKRLHAIEADYRRGRSADFEDQAQESENDEVLEGLAKDARDELERIHQALERMERDVYGICASCDEDIAEQRLLALPDAVLCVRCAEAAEA